MAEVLEAMGFPSDWCERALSSASGIETAVDLLLQWQAQGSPQFLSPTLRPASSPPSSETNVQSPEGAGHSRPTLKLLPIPTSDSTAVISESQISPSYRVRQSSSSGPTSQDGPSGLNEINVPESPGPAHPSRVFNAPTEVHNSGGRGRSGAALDRITTTSISCVDNARSSSGRGAGKSRNVANAESTDAVVPDVFAEERKSRYVAAQRAKQEKEAEKARIRQQLQEDMANRRLRSNMMVPTESDRTNVKLGKQPVYQSRPDEMVTDTSAPTQLQIRCPGNQVIKGSFSAGTTLKDVRAYVERQLQIPSIAMDSRENFDRYRPGAVPFSGQSSRLSSDRQAERVLLQAARENFELQTSRILASAKSLRDNAMEADMQNSGTMYFLIPIPRQEYFTERAMEVTLAQAQLVPRGTLVVQFRQSDAERINTPQAEIMDSSNIVVDDMNTEDNRAGGRRRPSRPCENSREPVQPRSKGQEAHELESGDTQVTGPSRPKAVSLSFERGTSGASKSGRNSLEVDGERVRVRELALQAAAKRMSEAAKLFRDGLPLGEGEMGGAFPFPSDGDNPFEYDISATHNRGTSPQQSTRAAPSDDYALTHLKSPGADAELSDASPDSKDRSSGSLGPDKPPPDRALDALHRQAMAAAEARLKTSQCQPSVIGSGNEEETEEAESRIGDSPCPLTEGALQVLGVSRRPSQVPLSSRLLTRPEKLQRTSGSPPSSTPASDNPEEQPGSSAKPQSQSAGPSHAFEAALGRFNALGDRDIKGKGPVQEEESPQVATPPSSHQAQGERQSSLRVRLEDGLVQHLTFPANTLLLSVRDSVVPEGADISAYGFFIPIPEPHFVEGKELAATLEEVGLVPRGIVHLIKMSTRGMVRQGRRNQRRRRSSDGDVFDGVGMFRHLADHPHERQDLTYEELMELEESIGRVHVGVPEEVISTLPVHTVKTKNLEETTEGDESKEDVDVCIVCMAEMTDGEEALSLPCVHTFHTLCIRRWLLQSTCCPTCKHCLV